MTGTHVGGERCRPRGALGGPALGLVLALAAGCRSLPPPAEPVRRLLDGFEEDRLWTLDSADNYGQVEYTDRHATEGHAALKLRFFDNGRGPCGWTSSTTRPGGEWAWPWPS